MGKVKEFASAWHRDEYVAAVGREISALEQRLEQIGDDMPNAASLKEEVAKGIKSAKAELARVKRSKGAKDDEPPTETADAEEPAEA